jgi:hypothetical protein
MTNLKNRLEKLENRFIPELPLCIIYYRENVETYEQRLQRFQEENGYELPDHATVICYERIS